MGPLITGATAVALRDGRERFNARFAAAGSGDHPLDGERFAAHLAGRVQPVVEAAERALPGSAAAVTEALYEASLDLLGHGLLDGDRGAVLAVIWEHVLPAAAAPLAADPRRVAAALCNGALRVAGTPGGRPGEWAGLMAAVARTGADADVLLDAGLVAAWRAGLAQARRAALERLGALPPEVAAAALGVPALAAGDVARLSADRWWRPGAAGGAPPVRVVARVGSFRGFGGVFLTPPRLTGAREGAFVVDGGTGPYLLEADAFGATLQRSPEGATPSGDRAEAEAEAEWEAPAFTLDADGTLTGAAGRATFPALAEATSWASSSGTLAVTTANSHAVTLVAAAWA